MIGTSEMKPTELYKKFDSNEDLVKSSSDNNSTTTIGKVIISTTSQPSSDSRILTGR